MNKILIGIIAILAFSCTREQQEQANNKISEINDKIDSLNAITNQINDGFSRQDSFLYTRYIPFQGEWDLLSVENGVDLTSQYGDLGIKISRDSFWIDYSQKGIKQKGRLFLYESTSSLKFTNINVLNMYTNETINYSYSNFINTVSIAGNYMTFTTNKDIIMGNDTMQFGQDLGMPNTGAYVDGRVCKIKFVFRRI